MERVEDHALLTGQGRFIDDLGSPPGTLHSAFLRSPHAHADIVSIDTRAALALPGIVAVLTGDDIRALTASLVVGIKARSTAGRSPSIASATLANPWQSSSLWIATARKTPSTALSWNGSGARR